MSITLETLSKVGIPSMKDAYALLWMRKPGVYYSIAGNVLRISAVHGSPFRISSHQIVASIRSGEIHDLRVAPKPAFVAYSIVFLVVPLLSGAIILVQEHALSPDHLVVLLFVAVWALVWLLSRRSRRRMEEYGRKIRLAADENQLR